MQMLHTYLLYYQKRSVYAPVISSYGPQRVDRVAQRQVRLAGDRPRGRLTAHEPEQRLSTTPGRPAMPLLLSLTLLPQSHPLLPART